MPHFVTGHLNGAKHVWAFEDIGLARQFHAGYKAGQGDPDAPPGTNWLDTSLLHDAYVPDDDPEPTPAERVVRARLDEAFFQPERVANLTRGIEALTERVDQLEQRLDARKRTWLDAFGDDRRAISALDDRVTALERAAPKTDKSWTAHYGPFAPPPGWEG